MKKFLSLSVILLCSYIINAQSNDWETIKDIYKEYRIDFPGTPKDQITDVPTAKGNVKMYSLTYSPSITSNDKNLVYMIAYTKYPSSMFPNDLKTSEDKQAMLDRAVNGSVTNTKGSLLSTDKVSFNGFEARKSKILIQNDYVIVSYLILVDLKLYMMQVICESKDTDNDKINDFFNSFELIKVFKD